MEEEQMTEFEIVSEMIGDACLRMVYLKRLAKKAPNNEARIWIEEEAQNWEDSFYHLYEERKSIKE